MRVVRGRLKIGKHFGALVLWAALGLFAVPGRASNFIIIPTYDSTIVNDANSAAIENAINLAIQQYENLITNKVTVDIYFEEMSGGLGASDAIPETGSYQSIYDQLVANNANPAAIAALNANGGNGNTNGGINPVTGNTLIDIKTPDIRALGFSNGPDCVLTTIGAAQYGLPYLCATGSGSSAYDGIIGLNVGITYPPKTAGSTTYGLISVAEHEIDEVLGLGSALYNCTPSNAPSGTACKADSVLNASNDGDGNPMPEDLFRWSAATGGTRTLGTNCASPTSAYFSYGPSTGAVAQFNNACNGADFGDWAGNSPVRTQDAFATPNTNPTIGYAEISALSAIGYDIAPEPSTWAMLLVSLAGLATAKRRLQR